MDETLRDRVARALIASGQHGAAKLLEQCALRLSDEGRAAENSDDGPHVIEIEFVGRQEDLAVLCDGEHPLTRAIRSAVRTALPPNTWIQNWTFAVADDDEEAPTEDTGFPLGGGVTAEGSASNQAADAAEVRVWQHLRFRSESELRVAQALDRAGVLFLPNCKARLGPANRRENREPDFLICAEGKWGILEVDGEPFHPPARTVHDHERARLFKAHGVRVVEHFDAATCYRDPDGVVRQFLELLRRG